MVILKQENVSKPMEAHFKWHLTDPYVMLIEGTIPFLISRGSTTHPASIAPSAGQLVDFWIEHPEPINIQQVLSAFKIEA